MAPNLILDTSAVIDLDWITAPLRSYRGAVTTITMAELAAGPVVASTSAEQARRQHRLQWVESTFRRPLPFDLAAGRAYAHVVAALHQQGRQVRRRSYDLLIAAVAISLQLPVATRNADDFAGLPLDVILLR